MRVIKFYYMCFYKAVTEHGDPRRKPKMSLSYCVWINLPPFKIWTLSFQKAPGIFLMSTLIPRGNKSPRWSNYTCFSSTPSQVRICSPSPTIPALPRWTAASGWRRHSMAKPPVQPWPSPTTTSYLRAPPTLEVQVRRACDKTTAL